MTVLDSSEESGTPGADQTVPSRVCEELVFGYPCVSVVELPEG